VQQSPRYASAGVATLDGDIVCSDVPLASPVNITDRPYFQRAVETRGFGVGEYQIGRVSHRQSINFGYPLLDKEGKTEGVVYLAIDLEWLNQFAATVQRPSGSTISMFDGEGTILVHRPLPQKWVGKSIVGLIQSPKQITGKPVSGADAGVRQYLFAPVLSGPGGSLYLALGQPR
jgi:hypothetical protein